MRIKILKWLKNLKGRFIPLAIMSIILFINATATVYALDAFITTMREKREESKPQPVNTYRTSMDFVEEAVSSGNMIVVPEVYTTKLQKDPAELFQELDELARLEEMRVERLKREEEERRLEEERRIAEEKRLEEERRIAEENRIRQINSINIQNDIAGSANLTVEQIGYMLEDTGLQGTEETLYNLQESMNLNVFIASAISIHESGWMNESYRARSYNNIYGINVGNRTSFSSKSECIEYFADFIDRLYIQEGLRSLQDIQPKYCPTDTEWDDQVWSIANQLYSKVISEYKI